MCIRDSLLTGILSSYLSHIALYHDLYEILERGGVRIPVELSLSLCSVSYTHLALSLNHPDGTRNGIAAILSFSAHGIRQGYVGSVRIFLPVSYTHLLSRIS